MRVLLQIQGSRVRSRSGPILSWRLIMKWFLRSFSSLPLIHSRRVVVSYKRKYLHELLVNRLFKPAQEKVWLGELTVPQWPKLLTWDVKQQNKQTNKMVKQSALSANSVEPLSVRQRNAIPMAFRLRADSAPFLYAYWEVLFFYLKYELMKQPLYVRLILEAIKLRLI